MIEFLTEPWTFEFMRRAFAVAMMSGAVCGVVGTFVVLRGMSFIGDAIIHSVFPGVAIGFAFKLNLALTGAVAGILTAIGITALSQNRRLKEDAVIGVLFALAFGSGIVIISTQDAYTGDLASFLFGQVLGISDTDVITVLVFAVVIVTLTLLIKKELVTVSLDRETAKVLGLPVFLLDVALYVLVTLAVVMSLQAVGNILVLALLIVPASTARLLSDRLNRMMFYAAGIGALGSLVGLYLSYHFDLSSGGLIVMVMCGIFFISWALAPRHGVMAWTRKAEDKLSEDST